MFQWLLEKSLGSRLFVLVAAARADGLGQPAGDAPAGRCLPDPNKPTVTVMTEAGGMAPEEVEQLLSFPLETAMSGLPGIANVRSISSAGLSFVYLTFDWRVGCLSRPADGQRTADALEATPAAWGGAAHGAGVVDHGRDHAGRHSHPWRRGRSKAAREYADWVLRPRLMAIAGVSQVIPIGGEVRQFQVRPDTRRMAELGIGLEQIESAVRGFAANTSGGFSNSTAAST